MQVSEIWRFPVKSMQGERLETATIGPYGIEGDRAWSLVDASTGLNLTGRREPELLYAAARFDDGQVVITLPDGSETDDDATLSTWLGRPVELRRAGADGSGTYEIQLDESKPDSWVQWSGPAGSFHDSTKTRVSLVSDDAFRSWDRRRFRTNVILDAPGDVELVGHEIEVGTVKLDVLKRIDRCVMTTRPQPAIADQPAVERDLDVLKTINREHDNCLGIGTVVVEPGGLSLGDSISVIGRGGVD